MLLNIGLKSIIIKQSIRGFPNLLEMLNICYYITLLWKWNLVKLPNFQNTLLTVDTLYRAHFLLNETSFHLISAIMNEKMFSLKRNVIFTFLVFLFFIYLFIFGALISVPVEVNMTKMKSFYLTYIIMNRFKLVDWNKHFYLNENYFHLRPRFLNEKICFFG